MGSAPHFTLDAETVNVLVFACISAVLIDRMESARHPSIWVIRQMQISSSGADNSFGSNLSSLGTH